jgi:hypothetical protein
MFFDLDRVCTILIFTLPFAIFLGFFIWYKTRERQKERMKNNKDREE